MRGLLPQGILPRPWPGEAFASLLPPVCLPQAGCAHRGYSSLCLPPEPSAHSCLYSLVAFSPWGQRLSKRGSSLSREWAEIVAPVGPILINPTAVAQRGLRLCLISLYLLFGVPTQEIMGRSRSCWGGMALPRQPAPCQPNVFKKLEAGLLASREIQVYTQPRHKPSLSV